MNEIEQAVKKLLGENDGHGYDHADRVRRLAVRFAQQEHADIEVVELASLLHDVDDYKLVGIESAKRQANARAILDENNITEDVKQRVLVIIATMGYSKLLEGTRPSTLEGKIVSDADMCDAIGSTGILRTHAYALSRGNVFFDKVSPVTKLTSAEDYRADRKSHSVQHFFDKLLLVPSILMTESGKKEGEKRKAIMIDFLRELFEEEDATEWKDYLEAFTKDS